MKTKYKKLFSLLLVGMFSLWITELSAQSHTGQKAKEGAGTGALLGAVAGAVFGYGHILDDALEGAIIGGGIGALSGALEGGKMDRQAKAEFEALVREFGEDNLRGYVELLKCNHEKAIALAKVGQVSNDREHQLVGLWLEAVAEKDRKNVDRIQSMYPDLVAKDADIDDIEMASVALNQLVLDLRSDRKANQLPSCIM